MTVFSRFTVHRNPDGVATGHGEALRRLGASGHRLRVMTVDTYGPIVEAASLAAEYSVDWVGVYRPTFRGQAEKSKAWNYGQSFDFDVPGNNYQDDVETAAERAIWSFELHVQAELPEWEPGTWFQFWNEIDHERLGYCAEVALRLARYAVTNGLQFSFFGINAGEPEPEDWEDPAVQAFLRYAAANPENVAVSLHEYSLNRDILHLEGDLVGRYQYLRESCRKNGIPWETLRVFITELGHGKDEASLPPVGIEGSVSVLGGVYHDDRNIDLLALWADSGDTVEWGGAALSQAVVDGWLHASRLAEGETPSDVAFLNGPAVQPEEPEDPDTYQAIVFKVPQGMTEEEWLRAARAAFESLHDMTASHHTTLSILRNSGDSSSFVKFWDPARDREAVAMVEAAGYRWENASPDADLGVLLPVDPLSQRDSRWSSVTLGQPTGHGLTIGRWGCLTVAYNSMARMLLGIPDLPAEFNARLVQAGAFRGPALRAGTLVQAFPSRFVYRGHIERKDGAAAVEEMKAKALEWLRKGVPVPVEVDFDPTTPYYRGEEQHWTLLVGWDPVRGWEVMDPWTGSLVYVSDRYDTPGEDLIQALFYDLREAPPAPEPTPPPPVSGRVFRMADYIFPAAMPDQFIMKRKDGSQERVHYFENAELGGVTMQKSTTTAQHYTLRPDGSVCLYWDTSHSSRTYYARETVKGSKEPALYCPAELRLGEPWTSPETHDTTVWTNEGEEEEGTGGGLGLVQFFQIVEHYDYYLTPWGEELEDVIVCETGLSERQFFAFGRGWCGWEADEENGFSGDTYRTPEPVNHQAPEPLTLPPSLRGNLY